MLTRRTLPGLMLALVAAGPALAQLAGAPTEPLAILTTGGARHAFSVEFADKPETRARGLMFRREMAADAGMLFDFGAEQDVSMWMKNTYISLDMLFIRPDGTIHAIAENTTPFSEATISSGGKVRAVLELNGGTAQRLGLRPGDRIEHRMFAR